MLLFVGRRSALACAPGVGRPAKSSARIMALGCGRGETILTVGPVCQRVSGRRARGLSGGARAVKRAERRVGPKAARAAWGGGERYAGLRGKREGGSRAGLLAPGVGRELGFAGKEKGEAGWDAGFCYGFSFSISYFLFQTLLKPN